jgi:peptidyl-prolyl cis-trans isomerase D
LEAANIFFGDSRDQKAFDANYEKSLKAKGIQKLLAGNIKPADDQVGQMGMMGGGSSRELVRSIYSASKGEVIKPERVGENYIVAVVTEIFKEGTQSVAAARPGIEPALRNKKKAEMLKKKVGTVTTLEAAAAALGGKPIEVADSIRMDARTPSALGFEPKAIGAAFNPANKGKVVPEVIDGTQGVYVIRVENVSTTPVTAGSVEEQRKELTGQKKQSTGNPLGALRVAATIKDKRGDRL